MTAETPAIDVTPAQWATVRALLDRHVPGVKVVAFGSRARRQSKPFSDLDLALIGSGPIPLSTLASLEHDLSESDLPYRVDLVDWHGLDEAFRRVITGDQVTVLPREPA